MHSGFIILVCLIGAIMAYPLDSDTNLGLSYEDVEQSLLRERRDAPISWTTPTPAYTTPSPFQLQGGGGGSPGQGFDFGLQGKAPVWTSDNGRHSVDAYGKYGQHLGGPYGNSQPQWGAGAGYTFRF